MLLQEAKKNKHIKMYSISQMENTFLATYEKKQMTYF